MMLGFPIMGFSMIECPSPKKIKGAYWEDAALMNQVKGEQPCEVVEGEGVVISIDFDQENPQFNSKSQISFLLWLPEWPEPGERHYLKPENSMVCYREVGTLLLFETFQATGWIKTEDSPRKEKVAGELEIQFVDPHHNFSNSDFQYLGGEFRLNRKLQ